MTMTTMNVLRRATAAAVAVVPRMSALAMMTKKMPSLAAAVAMPVRTLVTRSSYMHSKSTSNATAANISLTFVTPEGERIAVTGKEGESLLDVAHANEVELEGACEGSIACSTCHVILPSDVYRRLAEPTDEENDMLDMAFGLTETSRLGCQVTLSRELEGIDVVIPSATRNMMVDGHKPKPH